MTDLTPLFDAILTGKLDKALEIVKQALDEKVPPRTLIDDYMIKAMEEMGARFESGKAFVPEMMMAARAMKGALEVLRPQMVGSADSSLGKIIIGTVKGDLHDIGKNIVAAMLEGCGFEVINLGVDVAPQKFIDAVKSSNAQIVCLSALLTTTMPAMKTTIDAFTSAGIRSQVKFMVGGAPVTDRFAKEIGADGYSSNANAAVKMAKELIA